LRFNLPGMLSAEHPFRSQLDQFQMGTTKGAKHSIFPELPRHFKVDIDLERDILSIGSEARVFYTLSMYMPFYPFSPA
jgi:hypothetical protein